MRSQRIQRSKLAPGWRRGIEVVLVVIAMGLVGAAPETQAQKDAEKAEIAAYVAARKAFDAELARVDAALQTNPGRVPGAAIDSCSSRRRLAVRLFDIGQHERARRRLKYCVKMLRIPEETQQAAIQESSVEDKRAKAARELEKAVALEPDIAHGLEIWRECAACHRAEGWGLPNGSVPQLAGQHRTVVIKQLADIRAGSRQNSLMLPYAAIDRIGEAQSLADVAAYIDTLEISVDTDKGPGGVALERGERLYQEKCSRCHGAMGEGDAEAFVPRIQSQHYAYLVRQFESIRTGERLNAHPEMKALIQDFDEADTHAVLDYVSRLEPPEELQAPEGWRNPDFSD